MALKYQPNVGTLWMCDFNTGFKPPEMIKRRPVVVIAPHPKRQIGLCTIVPLSTTTPVPVEAFHHRMDPHSLPGKLGTKETWAKCDMLYTVSLERLSRATKRGEAATLRVLDEDLDAIRDCVMVALGLDADRRRGA